MRLLHTHFPFLHYSDFCTFLSSKIAFLIHFFFKTHFSFPTTHFLISLYAFLLSPHALSRQSPSTQWDERRKYVILRLQLPLMPALVLTTSLPSTVFFMTSPKSAASRSPFAITVAFRKRCLSLPLYRQHENKHSTSTPSSSRATCRGMSPMMSPSTSATLHRCSTSSTPVCTRRRRAAHLPPPATAHRRWTASRIPEPPGALDFGAHLVDRPHLKGNAAAGAALLKFHLRVVLNAVGRQSLGLHVLSVLAIYISFVLPGKIDPRATPPTPAPPRPYSRRRRRDH